MQPRQIIFDFILTGLPSMVTGMLGHQTKPLQLLVTTVIGY